MSYTTPVAGDASTTTATAIDTNFKETAQGLYVYAADSVGTDAYAITPSQAISAYVAGQKFHFKAGTKNTGPCTLAISGLAAKAIRKNYITPLKTGDIQAGQIVEVAYDATNDVFQMISPAATMNQQMSNLSIPFYMNTSGGGATTWDGICGTSDGTTKTFAIGVKGDSTNDYWASHAYKVAEDFGFSLSTYSHTDSDSITAGTGLGGVVLIGNDVWMSGTGTEIAKNGSVVTISGTPRYGSLSHDPTNSYLLVNYSTTKVARFSGIAGTTITNVSDITLDTAITSGLGFIFDNTNSRYIFLDTTNNLLRRFDSSGTTVDTVAYTFDDTNAKGLVVIDGRVYVVFVLAIAGISASGGMSVSVDFVPTNMTI